ISELDDQSVFYVFDSLDCLRKRGRCIVQYGSDIFCDDGDVLRSTLTLCHEAFRLPEVQRAEIRLVDFSFFQIRSAFLEIVKKVSALPAAGWKDCRASWMEPAAHWWVDGVWDLSFWQDLSSAPSRIRNGDRLK